MTPEQYRHHRNRPENSNSWTRFRPRIWFPIGLVGFFFIVGGWNQLASTWQKAADAPVSGSGHSPGFLLGSIVFAICLFFGLRAWWREKAEDRRRRKRPWTGRPTCGSTATISGFRSPHQWPNLIPGKRDRDSVDAYRCERASLRPGLEPCPALATFLLLERPAAAWRGETLEIKGTTYENVVVRSSSPTHITISHKGGICQIPLADLPPEWQDEYAYDPAVAARHRARIDAETRYRLKQDPGDGTEDEATPAGYTRLKPQIDFRVNKPSSLTRAKDQGRRPVNSIYATVTALEYAYGMDSAPGVTLGGIRALGRAPDLPGSRTGQGHPLSRNPEIDSRSTASAVKTSRPTRLRVRSPKSTRRQTKRSTTPCSDETSRPSPSRGGGSGRGSDPLQPEPEPPHRGRTGWPHYNALDKNPTLRKQTPLKDSLHTVTLIGYRPDPSAPDSVLLLFRNSFGPQWGIGGHGYVALEYLNRHLLGGFAVDLY